MTNPHYFSSDQLAKNFALVSALFAGATALTVTTYEYFYLFVFGRGLFWLVDYSDLARLSLPFFVLILFVVVSILLMPQFITPSTWLSWSKITGAGGGLVTATFTACVIFLVGRSLGGDELQTDIILSVTIGGIAALLMMGLHAYSSLTSGGIEVRTSTGIIIVLILVVAGLGSWSGLRVKHRGHNYTVTLKDAKDHQSTLNKVAIVMITSHHIIFHVNDSTVAVRSDDVVKIELNTGRESRPDTTGFCGSD
jgi:hypothetical protein